MEAELVGGDPAPETPSSESTPVETPSTETPTETPQGEQPTSSESPDSSTETPPEALYELPDGRKVDADTLQKEWKENFLPDYTRKSQRLSEIEKVTNPQPVTPEQKPWEDPNWQPQTYAEILEAAEARIEAKRQAQEQAEQERQTAIKTYVDGQEAAVKAIDPNADINAVYAHANKVKTSDLVAAYKNLQEMKELEKATEARVLKNLGRREADPVSIGAGDSPSDGISYHEVATSDMRLSAQEALARIKGK